jgi:hypothetical protein
MTSRFGLYQNSIKRFIANQSIVSNYYQKNFIVNMTNESEYILPISLLTVINGQQKKNGLKSVHGYEMATGIELLNVLLTIIETKKFGFTFNKEISEIKDISDRICQEIVSMIYQTLNRNINNIATYYSQEAIMKIYLLSSEHLHEKIMKINSTVASVEIPSNLKPIQKSDLKNFHFKNSENLLKLTNIKQLPKEFLLQYINGTYGSICKLSLISGWLIGGSPPGMITNLERLGYHFGIMLHIAYDFVNVERDIHNVKNDVSFNYVINFGFQDAFELFDESKKKFIEGVMTMNITTPTLKEFIDILESKVDNALELSSPDIKSSSSHP